MVLTECYWEASSRSVSRLLRRAETEHHDATPRSSGAVARRAIRLLDSRNTHYCVLSSREAAEFPGFWGIPASRVHFTPFCFGIDASVERPPAGSTVFAGGDSLRDYRALLAAAPSLPVPVVIATRLGEPVNRDNVRLGPLPSAVYDEELLSARIIVVPLCDGTRRSAGHQTYLSAMALGKPLIVTDSPGVRDYVTHRETGLIVPPNDPQQLAEAIRWLLDDANEAEVRRMCALARATALETYTLEAYLGRVLDVLSNATPAPA